MATLAEAATEGERGACEGLHMHVRTRTGAGERGACVAENDGAGGAGGVPPLPRYVFRGMHRPALVDAYFTPEAAEIVLQARRMPTAATAATASQALPANAFQIRR